MTRFADIAALSMDVQKTEHKYLLHGPRHDPVTNPWMPYQPADFIGILWECMPEMAGTVFLDVGCGPGTKMAIARELFGLEVFGIEIDEEMAAAARKYFRDLRPNRIRTADVLKSGYDFAKPDLLWLYRPFRDPLKEHAMELLITGLMKPGAILAGSSWEIDVSALGWQPIVDDCLISPDGHSQIIRGAWQKPRE